MHDNGDTNRSDYTKSLSLYQYGQLTLPMNRLSMPMATCVMPKKRRSGQASLLNLEVRTKPCETTYSLSVSISF